MKSSLLIVMKGPWILLPDEETLSLLATQLRHRKLPAKLKDGRTIGYYDKLKFDPTSECMSSV